MTVTAVVIGHEDQGQVMALLEELRKQPIDEFIVCVCCMSLDFIDADIKLVDKHVDDVGQRLCDYGIRLASSDYLFLASSDDGYSEDFVEKMKPEGDPDLVLAGFSSHLVGNIKLSKPEIGAVTRGSFLVKTKKAQEVGYNGRDYSSDGQFIRDLIEAGATWVQVPEILHQHN